MAQQRSTFAKLQREREKKEKAVIKADRRANRAAAAPSEEAPAAPDPDTEASILTALAELHAAFEDGALSIEDFEERRDQLRKRLQIG